MIAPVSCFPTGVTSIASSNHGLVVVGTKTGRILVSSDDDRSEGLRWEEFDRAAYGPKYPIYSLSIGHNLVFAGAGDRYISVWTLEESGFGLRGILGPHTGWVKDLAYCENSSVLYSIGCNCIESWDVKDTSRVKHLSKRRIENSPEMGSTLSSDLLSLCLLSGECLLSGGVDGRIHTWSLDPMKNTPLYSSRIHDGRVNAVTYASQLRLIFSVGNDGKIATSQLTDGSDGLRVVSELVVDDKSVRLSSLHVTKQQGNTCLLVVGTTAGGVIFIEVRVDEGAIQMRIDRSFSLDGEPTVYSVGTYDDDSSLLVGHAKGLVQIEAF